jgi:hypothetical protein
MLLGGASSAQPLEIWGICAEVGGAVRRVRGSWLARTARLGPEAVFGKPVDIEQVLRTCEATEAIAC